MRFILPARVRFFVFLFTLTSLCQTFGADGKPSLPPDSQRQLGVPQGEIQGPFEWKSEVFPGTTRNYWIYVPAQYNPQEAACVMVVQDGLSRAQEWNLPVVLDNLIHKEEIPVTIGIFIDPGVVPAPRDEAQPRFNRSFEYDALGDRYARFLVEEILPAIGEEYNLSNDPNDRLIAGASSGGICAFNAAWERPDAFRRVLSTIGTFVGLRGGHEFPVLVRKSEPKPIRVFLQDGSNDLNIYAGDWWMANQSMLSALQWAGYDVRHAWGDGGHNSRHASLILPDALRWLWRDYPDPIETGSGTPRRMDLLIPGEGWQLVSEGYEFTEGPAVNEQGEVFFTDIPSSRIYKIGLNGEVTLFASGTGRANGLMFGPDGNLYACADGKKEIVAYSPDGSLKVVVDKVSCNDLVIGPNGIYFTDPANRKVFYIDAERKVYNVDTGIERPNGLALSPDRTQLYVADTRGQFGYAFQVQADGLLAAKQPFLHLHVPYGATNSGADGMTVDTEGRIYVATSQGLQVCDQLGRVHLILNKPQDAWLSNVVLGGPDLDTLFVTCGDKVYQRKVNARGFLPWQEPIKPPRPKL